MGGCVCLMLLQQLAVLQQAKVPVKPGGSECYMRSAVRLHAACRIADDLERHRIEGRGPFKAGFKAAK